MHPISSTRSTFTLSDMENGRDSEPRMDIEEVRRRRLARLEPDNSISNASSSDADSGAVEASSDSGELPGPSAQVMPQFVPGPLLTNTPTVNFICVKLEDLQSFFNAASGRASLNIMDSPFTASHAQSRSAAHLFEDSGLSTERPSTSGPWSPSSDYNLLRQRSQPSHSFLAEAQPSSLATATMECPSPPPCPSPPHFLSFLDEPSESSFRREGRSSTTGTSSARKQNVERSTPSNDSLFDPTFVHKGGSYQSTSQRSASPASFPDESFTSRFLPTQESSMARDVSMRRRRSTSPDMPLKEQPRSSTYSSYFKRSPSPPTRTSSPHFRSLWQGSSSSAFSASDEPFTSRFGSDGRALSPSPPSRRMSGAARGQSPDSCIDEPSTWRGRTPGTCRASPDPDFMPPTKVAKKKTTSEPSPGKRRRGRPRKDAQTPKKVNICNICKEEASAKCVNTPCGHFFHESCLNNWFAVPGQVMKALKTCPTCGSEFNPNRINPVYL